jgi:phosphomannomutase
MDKGNRYLSDTRKLEPTILREYDIRGIVGDKFNMSDVRSIGRGFGSILKRLASTSTNPIVAIGYDGRLSSPELSDAICAGLIASGVDVINVGLGPTPMLYFTTHELETDGGMMITGSHNPPDYNGIKMVLGGKPFFGADIQELGKIVERGDFTEGIGDVTKLEINSRYIERLLKDFSGKKELSVAWDPGNGAAGEVLQQLIARLPGKHFLINEKIDGTFPAHHPDPTLEENLHQLKLIVFENNCDLGIGFDGDGDRIGIIDGEGRVLWGDQLLIILARDVLKENPGASIITEVKASKVFFSEVAKAGGNPVMWATGHSLIKSKMIELNAPLAGEMSGHIFFADKYYGYDDALYAAIRLLNILSRSDKSIAEIRNQLPQMVNTPELRFNCPDERKFDVIAKIKEGLSQSVNTKIYDIDGVRVETTDGWWLLRASNTQAALVARCESSSASGLARLKETVRKHLDANGINLPDSFE